MWKKVWLGTMSGYAWDDEEWMRRIELAEDGDATASAVLTLYDSLMSREFSVLSPPFARPGLRCWPQR